MSHRYALDAGRSRFTVQAFAGGFLSALAHNPTIAIRDFTGELRFSPETAKDASLQVAMQADSLTPTDDVNARDRPEIESRMRKEALETAAYPEIRYQAAAVSAARIAENWYRVQFKGDLSLHGVVQLVVLDVQVLVREDEVRLSGEFKLLLSAFRIKRISALAGAITLKDELKFKFDVVGRRDPV
jgi:polyisoprenoid-binding protein YceI